VPFVRPLNEKRLHHAAVAAMNEEDAFVAVAVVVADAVEAWYYAMRLGAGLLKHDTWVVPLVVVPLQQGVESEDPQLLFHHRQQQREVW